MIARHLLAKGGGLSISASGGGVNRMVQLLEFPVVFMPFLESMPHMRDDVAGEARLLYVAMTRAMEHLVLTHHGNSAFVGQLREAVRRSAA